MCKGLKFQYYCIHHWCYLNICVRVAIFIIMVCILDVTWIFIEIILIISMFFSCTFSFINEVLIDWFIGFINKFIWILCVIINGVNKIVLFNRSSNACNLPVPESPLCVIRNLCLFAILCNFLSPMTSSEFFILLK